MSIVTPIKPRPYAVPDPDLVKQISRNAVPAFPPLIRDLDEDGWEADVTTAELAVEYTSLVAYADAAATEEGEIEYQPCADIIDEDGRVRFVREVEAIKADEWPRALMTAALQARALRKALDRAEQQFAALLWTARGMAEVVDETDA